MENYFMVIFGIFLLMSGCTDRKANNQTAQDKNNTNVKQVQIKRYCMTLDLKDNPKLIDEYKYWHQGDHIWPEIPKGIREIGILDMEIYLLGTRLFMIMEVPEDFNFDRQMAKLAGLPRQAEWETFVSKFQKSSPDAKSSEKWRMMDRIFKLP